MCEFDFECDFVFCLDFYIDFNFDSTHMFFHLYFTYLGSHWRLFYMVQDPFSQKKKEDARSRLDIISV